MSSESQVDVLMCAYNAAPYIDAAIESIRAQSLTHWQLTVCDDCSTDDTANRVAEWCKRDARIRLIRNEKNLGVAATRNHLVRMTQAPLIAWQDADDISTPDRLFLQASLMSAHPQVGMCGGYMDIFSESGSLGTRRYDAADPKVRSKIYRHAVVAHPVAMLRRSVLEQVGAYDETLVPEDLDMCFRIARVAELANVTKSLVRYRVHPGAATSRKLRRMEEETFKIRWRHRHDRMTRARPIDYVFNLAQYLSMHLMPAKVRISLFNWWRND